MVTWSGVGVEEVKPVKPDGKRERFLFQGEAFWIHTLQMEHPQGLNEELLPSCLKKTKKKQEEMSLSGSQFNLLLFVIYFWLWKC